MRPAATAIAFGGILAACQLFVKIDNEKGVDAAPPPPVIDTCQKKHPPLPPATSDKNAPDIAPILYAARTFAVAPEDGTVIGFDLDGRCTGNDASATKAPGCVNSATTPDGPGGIDNSLAAGVHTLPLPGDATGTVLTNNVKGGLFTLLVQLTKWNGQANDSEVAVAFFSSATACHNFGPDNKQCFDGGSGMNGGGHQMPKWDGLDSWSYIADRVDFIPFTDGGKVVTPASAGYVVDNQLVISGVNAPELHFGLGAASMTLQQPVFVATLYTLADGRHAMKDAVIGGAAPADGMLAFVDRIQISSTPVCQLPLRASFVSQTCAARDMELGGNEAGICDGVSFAFGFTAEETVLDDPTTVDLGDPCASVDASTCGP